MELFRGCCFADTRNLASPNGKVEGKAVMSGVGDKPTALTDPGLPVLFGRPGGPQLSLPPAEVQLAPVDATVLSSMSGPDGGVQAILSCTPGFKLPWHKSKDWAYGSSISMYDATISAGKPTRSGDPIADCFSIITYKHGALLAVADGVSWGEPARRAARCAVLGATKHLHAMLEEQHLHEPGPSAATVFKELRAAMQAAQALILQQCGTLTTLVLTLVLRVQDSSKQQQQRSCWAALTLTVGDSLAYVYRALEDVVQELTYGAHENCVRNVAATNGSLGRSLGDDPDLGNMTASITLLHEGDVVFLASDGVSDNFNPIVLKLAKPAAPSLKDAALQLEGVPSQGHTSNGSLAESVDKDPSLSCLPVLSPVEMHAKTMELLHQAIKEVLAQPFQQLVSAQLPDRFVVSLDSDGDNCDPLQVVEDDPGFWPDALTHKEDSWTAKQKRGGGAEAVNQSSELIRVWSAPLGSPLRREGAPKDFGTRGISIPQSNICGQQAPDKAAATPAAPTTIAERLVRPPSVRHPSPSLTPPPSPRPVAPRRVQLAPEPQNARALVDGLLQHVYKVTEPLRVHTASLAASTRADGSSGRRRSTPTMPCTQSFPGKLDHATLVAYTVGYH